MLVDVTSCVTRVYSSSTPDKTAKSFIPTSNLAERAALKAANVLQPRTQSSSGRLRREEERCSSGSAAVTLSAISDHLAQPTAERAVVPRPTPPFSATHICYKLRPPPRRSLLPNRAKQQAHSAQRTHTHTAAAAAPNLLLKGGPFTEHPSVRSPVGGRMAGRTANFLRAAALWLCLCAGRAFVALPSRAAHEVTTRRAATCAAQKQQLLAGECLRQPYSQE